jgi:hypothetical protein
LRFTPKIADFANIACRRREVTARLGGGYIFYRRNFVIHPKTLPLLLQSFLCAAAVSAARSDSTSLQSFSQE